jgi:hypothetical protein
MRIIAIIFVCLCLFLPAGPAFGQIGDAAMVVDLSGTSVYESGSEKGNQVELMDFLAKGDVIRLEEGARLVLNYFASGLREEIDGPGQITIDLEQSRNDQKVAIKSSKVEFVPSQAQVQVGDAQHTGVVALRSPPPMVPPLTASLNPNHTALRGLPIALQWEPQPGVSRYAVVVADVLEDVVFKTETDSTQVVVEKTDIKSGEEYVWKAQDAGAPELGLEGQARFYLLSPEKLSELSHTEAYIKKTYKEGSSEALIALAMLYKKYELNAEAKTVLAELLEANPRNRNINRHMESLGNNYHPGS